MFLISLGIILFAALVLRRLIGIRRGQWIPTLAAVVLGEAAALAVLDAITHRAIYLPWSWYPLGIGMVAAFSMLSLVIIEMIFPPRDHPRPFRLPRPFTAIRRTGGRGIRYTQVGAIALRKGLFGTGSDGDDMTGSRLGRSLASTFEDAGGLFVKLGQAMAAQPQLVTPAVAAALTRLNDQATPADPKASRSVIAEEIGEAEHVFAAFDPEPVAAASLAQTYFATLPDGRAVVVKVQRPGIRGSVERDLDILVRLAERLDRRTTWARSIGLSELVAGFAEATREELDYRIEAANGLAAREALADGDPIIVPAIIEEYTTSRVLVQERIPGRSVAGSGAFDGISAESRRALADGLLALTMRQMISGERFHADPHPGNVLICPDGRLGLIDFGAVGRLGRYERTGLIDIFRALQTEDPSLLRQAALHIGTPTGRLDADAFDRDLARLLAQAIRADGKLDTGLFADALGVFRDYGIVMPRSTTTLFRTLVTLLGTLEVISPGYQVTDAVRRLGPEAISGSLRPNSVKEFVQQQVLNTGPVLARLPRDLDEIARSLLRGELRTRVSLFTEPEDLRFIQSMFNRLITTVTGSVLTLASALLLAFAPQPERGVSLLTIVGGVGMTFSVLLLLRTLIQILRPQRPEQR